MLRYHIRTIVSLLGYHIRTMSVEHHNVHTIVIIMPCSLAPNFSVFLLMPLVNSHLGKDIWNGPQHVRDCKQCRCHHLGMVLRVNVNRTIRQMLRPFKMHGIFQRKCKIGLSTIQFGCSFDETKQRNPRKIMLQYSPFPQNVLLTCEPLVSFAHLMRLDFL